LFGRCGAICPSSIHLAMAATAPAQSPTACSSTSPIYRAQSSELASNSCPLQRAKVINPSRRAWLSNFASDRVLDNKRQTGFMLQVLRSGGARCFRTVGQNVYGEFGRVSALCASLLGDVPRLTRRKIARRISPDGTSLASFSR